MASGIDDVARAAGVSTATVSRALRGLPNVNHDTRERVRRVAAQLGYVASPSAASLASGRTRTIGLISPMVNRWYFSNVIEGAERALRSQGFDVLLYTFELRGAEGRVRVDADVLRRRVDGVLVVGLPLEEDEVEALLALGHPLVCIGWGGFGQVTVRLDDHTTAVEATQHLIDLGHRTIGHITGSPDDVAPWSPPIWREAGWRAALEGAGLEVSEDLMVHGGFDVQGGRASMRRLVEARPDVTAVFVASDEMAMGAVLALRDLGLRVPDDVSVVGIDGHDLGELVGLTTMVQPAPEQGAMAAQLVLDMIAGVVPPRELVVPTELLVRSSTAPPRRAGIPSPRGAPVPPQPDV
ncbi:LacI family DNA-binding transcriptional regulator [Actinotalea sp. BY-33]|uniref:LacI family DNA-binding transcriptional regulator n=1 Tax=Actinotalea soli TaxID=2819234 RepID=A0A939LNT6_9CELL|nr:LacI family DNA-binding transcriptional regulator [Actinotalea soli]MBO1751521.1 LacI family DNA-binding transcriptional regulator [Actinotalea soli]